VIGGPEELARFIADAQALLERWKAEGHEGS
jgi:hypothetical protein